MRRKYADLIVELAEINPEAQTADGFEDALIGICYRFGSDPLAAYDREECIKILMARDGMDRDDAEEFFEFNVIGSWVGVGTPVFIDL